MISLSVIRNKPLIQTIPGDIIPPANNSHLPFFGLTHIKLSFTQTRQDQLVHFGQSFKDLFFHSPKIEKTPRLRRFLFHCVRRFIFWSQ